MFDPETKEHYVWYVSQTVGGSEYSPSQFNVTRLGESYVTELIGRVDLATRLRKDSGVDSIDFGDYATEFAGESYESLDGESDSRCLLNNDNRLSDVISGEVFQAFVSELPISMEKGLESNEFDGGLHIRMSYVSCHASGDGLWWYGVPKHRSERIETVLLTKKNLVKLSAWLATAKKVANKVLSQ